MGSWLFKNKEQEKVDWMINILRSQIIPKMEELDRMFSQKNNEHEQNHEPFQQQQSQQQLAYHQSYIQSNYYERQEKMEHLYKSLDKNKKKFKELHEQLQSKQNIITTPFNHSSGIHKNKLDNDSYVSSQDRNFNVNNSEIIRYLKQYHDLFVKTIQVFEQNLEISLDQQTQLILDLHQNNNFQLNRIVRLLENNQNPSANNFLNLSQINKIQEQVQSKIDESKIIRSNKSNNNNNNNNNNSNNNNNNINSTNNSNSSNNNVIEQQRKKGQDGRDLKEMEGKGEEQRLKNKEYNKDKSYKRLKVGDEQTDILQDKKVKKVNRKDQKFNI